MSLMKLEEEVSAAITGEELPLPGVILAAGSRNDDVHYLKSFGKAGIKEDSAPLSVDTPLSLASVTKLVTSVAAVRCIFDDQLIGLDDDVTKVVPELTEFQALKSFDVDGKTGAGVCTGDYYHELLSHTVGMATLENPLLCQYHAAIGNEEKATFLMRYFGGDDATRTALLPQLRKAMASFDIDPLLFQPGTGWNYGPGTDWAGKMIETLTKTSLEDYCQEHIFKPVGMSNTTFRPAAHHEIDSRIPQLVMRTHSGSLKAMDSFWSSGPPDMGGSGLVSSASDFLKLLTSLLHNDGKVLKPETTDIILNARVTDHSIFENEDVKEGLEDELEPGIGIDHCLAGCVNLDPFKETGRHAGSVSWAGATCCYWWLDRSAGVCGFYGSQVLAAMEQGISRKMSRRFEKAVYDAMREIGISDEMKDMNMSDTNHMTRNEI